MNAKGITYLPAFRAIDIRGIGHCFHTHTLPETTTGTHNLQLEHAPSSELYDVVISGMTSG